MPVESTVGRLPHSAGCRAGVIDVRIARLAHHGAHAVAGRPDETKFKMGKRRFRLGILRLSGRSSRSRLRAGVGLRPRARLVLILRRVRGRLLLSCATGWKNKSDRNQESGK